MVAPSGSTQWHFPVHPLSPLQASVHAEHESVVPDVDGIEDQPVEHCSSTSTSASMSKHPLLLLTCKIDGYGRVNDAPQASNLPATASSHGSDFIFHLLDDEAMFHVVSFIARYAPCFMPCFTMYDRMHSSWSRHRHVQARVCARAIVECCKENAASCEFPFVSCMLDAA